LPELRLIEKNTVVSGVVATEVGTPLATADVEAFELEGAGDVVVGGGTAALKAQTDGQGRFEFRVDPARRYLIRVRGALVLQFRGCAQGDGPNAMLTFPASGGALEVIVKPKKR
jgi:hypothetical protein